MTAESLSQLKENDKNKEREKKQQSSEARLLQIFVDETSRYNGEPLYEALLELMKQQGCAGATVLNGIAGFGWHNIIHKDVLKDTLPELPIVIEVVDTAPQIEKMRPQIEKMLTEGLVVVQNVEIWKATYQPRLLQKHPSVTIAQVMNNNVTSVHTDSSPSEIIRLMLKQDYYKALPVLNDKNHIVGIITEDDLLEKGGLPQQLDVLSRFDRESLQQFFGELRQNTRTATDIMTSPAITVRPEMSVQEAAKRMVNHHLKRLPVVDANGQLVGIIGRLDVLKVAAQLISRIKKASEQGANVEAAKNILNQVAEDLMVTDIPAVSPNMSVLDLIETVIGSRFRRAVVIDEQRHVLGVITAADLIEKSSGACRREILTTLEDMHTYRHTQLEHLELRPNIVNKNVGEVMTEDIIKIRFDESFEDVLNLFIEKPVKLLPVVDRKSRLLGAVLRENILGAIVKARFLDLTVE